MSVKSVRPENGEPTWLSIRQGMKHSGLARQTLLARGLLGVLEVREFGGRLWVTRESLDAHRASSPAIAHAS